jgi:hypothetical protein
MTDTTIISMNCGHCGAHLRARGQVAGRCVGCPDPHAAMPALAAARSIPVRSASRRRSLKLWTVGALVVLGALAGWTVLGGLFQPRKAELLTWHTTREPLAGSQGSWRLTEQNSVFLLVTVRAAGKKLYRTPIRTDGMPVAKSRDFVLSAADGRTVEAFGFRSKSSKDFSVTTYVDKPDREEEIEIAFVADSEFARGKDLVLAYCDWPPIPLEEGKRQAPNGRSDLAPGTSGKRQPPDDRSAPGPADRLLEN